LDLSAGLGGPMRRITGEFKVQITGFEPDPEVAARGMEMSIAAGQDQHAKIQYYSSTSFAPDKTVSQLYDCIMARETFYRVEDKLKFFKALAGCTKREAQLSFTDYIVNPEDKNKPDIVAWMAQEKNASPLGLMEMAETWAKANFKLRVLDDQTDFYRKIVRDGMEKFAAFLASGVHSDQPTRIAVLKRMDTWKYRMAAMDQGMKFYRFYASK
jgi:hypothetical protein